MNTPLASAPVRLTAALAGRYRIERELGAGGMATVYLADDVRHDRKVAIKVLKPELAAVLGAERFVVEIKTTAAMSHPHILPLFDSGTADGFLFYVMPYIQGETIREKLNRETQFGVDEAVRIAREVADALDYAHRHGVIHRDIKPENILLHDGRAMVMDFGIALAVSAAAGGRMTETGLSLGTPHYMSPEQATADKEISGRSDVYSLASVLYEMLAGQPPHLGGSAQQIIMKIIAESPADVATLRKSVPPNVAAALAKALEKLPADRFESARAFADALGSPGFTHRTSAATATSAAPTATSRNRLQLVTLGVLLLVTAAAAAWGWLRPQPLLPAVRLDLNLGVAPPLANTDVVISPDGSMLAYSGQIGGGQYFIYLRRLDGGGDFQRLEGTGSGFAPDFSPDSKWIVFRRDRENALAKVSVAGAGASTIPSSTGAFYAHWGPDNRIVYTGPGGTFIVHATGGTATNDGDQLKIPVPDVRGRHASILPDGSGVLGVRDQNIVVYSFATKNATVVARNGRHPAYAETGHILYVSEDDALFAVPFDLKRHRVTGDPVRVVDRVVSSGGSRGYSISRNGTLVYFEGPASGAAASGTNLFVVVRFAGGVDTLRLPSGNRSDPRFSPDGKTVAYALSAQRGIDDRDLYTYDLASRTSTQITFAGDARDPIWSPDGTRLLYSMRDSSGNRLVVKNANNSGEETTVFTGQGDLLPSGWPQPDVVLLSASDSTGLDLFGISPRAGASMTPYVREASDDRDVTLSPDGKLAALVNDDGVWLRDFPAPVGKWRVSESGGDFPRWSRDGRYLYFWRRSTPFDTLYRARIDRTPAVVVNTPEVAAAIDAAGINNWDLHPDGARFIVAVPDVPIGATLGAPGTPGARRHLVVLNWFTELTARMKLK